MHTKRTMLITGGMGGVGQAVATRLAKDGFSVALLHYKSPQKEVNTFIRTLGKGHSAYKCDITKPKEVASAVTAAKNKHGGIYGLVHCATAPIVRKTMQDLPASALRTQFEVDVLGALNVLQQVGPHLQKAGEGVIVGISSIFIEHNRRAPRMGSYVTAKYALRGLLREFAHELMPYQVRVNVVAPSMMQTRLSEDLPPKVFEFAKEQNPMKAQLTPKELAKVVAFLCSDEAKAITGVSLPVAFGEVETL